VMREILGSIALVFWSIQLVPQAVKNYRKQSTAGLSHWMMLIWGLESCLFGIYAIHQRLATALIIQPQLFLFFSLLCFAQYLYYTRKYSICTSAGIYIGSLMLAAGMQFALTTHRSYIENPSHHIRWIVDGIGSIATALVVLGFVPQYITIIRLHDATGLSKVFLFMDMQGAIFSLSSLAFHPVFDMVAASGFIGTLTLDFGLLV
ncbi:PQ loop repeat-domain-containing protein, partial [Thamnocephalis sphaerospora]